MAEVSGHLLVFFGEKKIPAVSGSQAAALSSLLVPAAISIRVRHDSQQASALGEQECPGCPTCKSRMFCVKNVPDVRTLVESLAVFMTSFTASGGTSSAFGRDTLGGGHRQAGR
ncbi:hypothetical protein Bbelb_158700 [Branchiostoma belcheri]|nr:hypothetical protein Bbelb_158700 [Branchiostoma belcheri]